MTPMLSILVPTRNRAALLDLCLLRLHSEMHVAGVDYEIVISDNASEDETNHVAEDHMVTTDRIRYVRRETNDGHVANWLNAARHARGEYVAHCADDDLLIPSGIVKHIADLEATPNRVAVFADWIAWDDQDEKELHRYFNKAPDMTFMPHEPLRLIDHIFRHQLYPEMFIARREAFLRSFLFTSHNLPQLLWMYRLSRQGEIAFSAEPFYKETRRVKDGYDRGTPENMSNANQYIGDEMRGVLETLVQWAITDAVPRTVGPLAYRDAINGFLHNRTALEVQRACDRGDFIRACELARRLNLWCNVRGGERLPIMAAKQHAERIGDKDADLPAIAANYAVCSVREANTLTIT